MSIEPFDWFNRFFAGSRPFGRRNSLFEGFDEMRREMEREFEENLRDIENKVPKDLITEYVTEDGAIVREIGPLVYGSTTTIGARWQADRKGVRKRQASNESRVKTKYLVRTTAIVRGLYY
jgi:hypothetical protein